MEDRFVSFFDTLATACADLIPSLADNGPKPIQPQVSAEKATSHALAAVIGGPVTGGIPVHADVEKRA